MRTRWIVAAVAALALASVAAGTLVEIRIASLHGPSCAADAKTANLDFTMKDLNGQDVTLSQFKGSVILLDFWATWCGPCKVEIPAFIDFQNKYKKDGLRVVGVSIDDTPEKLQPYVRDMHMNYTVLQGLGHDDVQNAYGPMWAIPVTVLISREGKICATHMGLTDTAAFEREIQGLLKGTGMGWRWVI
jgi:cytochrome c biogenesis protein CcmG/thiol:disulfide interchange protein DsbE